MSEIDQVSYRHVAGWGADSWSEDITGVAVDGEDNVYVLRRTHPQVTILNAEGHILDCWGHDCFSGRPHMITIDQERILITDDGCSQIFIFDLSGELVETVGSGIPSETGYRMDKGMSAEDALTGLVGGDPFNRPTKAVALGGDLYVSDGYRNCRVHRLSGRHNLIASWGGAGAAEGCFVIPHSLAAAPDGRIFVCDRENDRVQIFDSVGTHLQSWTDMHRPTDIAFDRWGNVYVAELPRGPGDLKSWRLGRASVEHPGRVTVFDASGVVITRFTGGTTALVAPHAIAVDSTGAIYVSEIPAAFNSYSGRTDAIEACLHKFEPFSKTI